MSKKNIFAKFQDYVNKPKRNVFDLSFANNITTKFGQLTPVFCKECIPGDSFKIHSRFALQMMPMKFPVQTPMRAYLHYFYVRNRTLYKDWMDFIGGTKDNLTLPYVQPTDKHKFYRVGGLADYLGVPNTLYSSESVSQDFTYNLIGANQRVSIDSPKSGSFTYVDYATYVAPNWVDYNFLHYPKTTELTDAGFPAYVNNAKNYLVGTSAFSVFYNLNPNNTPNPWGIVKTINSDTDKIDYRVRPWSYLGRVNYRNNLSFDLDYPKNDGYSPVSTHKFSFIFVYRDSNGVILDVNGRNTDVPVVDGSFKVTIFGFDAPEDTATMEVYVNVPYKYTDNSTYLTVNYSNFYGSTGVVSVKFYSLSPSQTFTNIGDLAETPYDSDIHLNALPFRAYEAIYNSYYRNAQNNPYILNNVAEYNKYIPSYDGGADTNDYDLHQRNWEYDFLTSAVQTPQQGDIAPLVGISVTGEATFQDENGNTYYASAQYDDNGNITGWTSHSPNMPQGSLRLLMDMAGTGISINDLRNVNAFQKFLENNIRRGLKYRDQIKSHFGVNVRYDELDMPEFIGGCSTDVNINKLSQTSESGNTPLGSFVGQASAYGESKHDITHYCDEHGFIIGILSIVPVPVYSQLLPKFFLKSEQLDYFFPEFGHIGYQPILQKEVSPLQTYYSGQDLNKVFGYQRSWYDYLDSTDEVHGQFRTTMRDFLMNRTFEDEPELSKDFLLVDPDQLNDVFLAGTDDDDIYAPEADKIIGSLYFNVSKKSPIPLFGIPRLD